MKYEAKIEASVKYPDSGSQTLVLADQEPLFTGESNAPSGFDFAEIFGCKVWEIALRELTKCSLSYSSPF